MGKLNSILKDIKKINKLGWNDIKASFMLLCAIIPALYIRYTKHPWLLCERKDNAQDNAWIFYNWLKKAHSEQEAFFVLDARASSFDVNDNHIIKWESFKHYIYYVASEIFVKAMFNGPQPNGRVCHFYEKYIDKKQTVYLRHGVAKDGCEHHSYDALKVRLFICGAKPEYDYFLKNAGYPVGHLKLTGFARFDDLFNNKKNENFILIMPTWRRYLSNSHYTKEQNEKHFVNSCYFKQYTELLNSTKFSNFIFENKLKVKFCLHAEFLRYYHLFDHNYSNIEFLSKNVDVHQLLMRTSLLITDYSSVFFDVAYMCKPTIFYQFDYEEFRSKHLSEGYFSYERDGFGPIATNIDELMNCILKCHSSGKFAILPEYEQRIAKFFPIRDNKNCDRIYEEIKIMEFTM